VSAVANAVAAAASILGALFTVYLWLQPSPKRAKVWLFIALFVSLAALFTRQFVHERNQDQDAQVLASQRLTEMSQRLADVLARIQSDGLGSDPSILRELMALRNDMISLGAQRNLGKGEKMRRDLDGLLSQLSEIEYFVRSRSDSGRRGETGSGSIDATRPQRAETRAVTEGISVPVQAAKEASASPVKDSAPLLGFITGNVPAANIASDRASSSPVSIYDIHVVSGNNQMGHQGPLPERLIASVTDRRGTPVSTVPVTWSVIQGSATLLQTTGFSSNDGYVSTVINFGSTPGTVLVRVSVGVPSALFALTNW
jgi:hypothetical protein